MLMMKLLALVILLGCLDISKGGSIDTECVRRRCSRVRRHANGFVRGSRRIGKNIVFYCNVGYILQGPSSRSCICEGGRPVWQGERPICVSEGN